MKLFFKKYYFITISSLLLVSAIIAFSDNLFTDIHQKSNSNPKFIVHGLFMFTWFGIFVMQTYYIMRQKFLMHKKLGHIGFLVAIGVFLSTLYVFIAVYKDWRIMEPFVRANRLLMLSFATFLIFAYANRKNAIKHKRYIFWAIALPLEPIMGRLSDFFQVDNWVLFYVLVWHTIFISFFTYDWQMLKRIHPISWTALGWFYVAWIISLYS